MLLGRRNLEALEPLAMPTQYGRFLMATGIPVVFFEPGFGFRVVVLEVLGVGFVAVNTVAES